MRMSLMLAGLLALGQPTRAEMRDEVHLFGGGMVKITAVKAIETLTVGPSDDRQMPVLSGADVGIVAFAADADSVALLGVPVLVAEITGTHSCDEGDARLYWAVTLGEVPIAEGPVATCQPMTASVTASGWVLLEGEGEVWAWAPGKRWSVPAN